MVWKGSMKDSKSYKWIQEVHSFRKRHKVPGKCFQMLDIPEGLKKYLEASEGHRGVSEGSDGHNIWESGRYRKVTRKNSIR